MDPIALVEITDTASLHCGRVGFVESIDGNHAWVQLLQYAETGDYYSTRLEPVGVPVRVLLARLTSVLSPVAWEREKEIELAASLAEKNKNHTGQSLHSRRGNIREIKRESGRVRKPQGNI